MFNSLKIRELLEIQRKTKKSLGSFVSITPKALDSIINGESMPKADNLEKIADFFKLPIDYFFDRNIELPNSAMSVNGDGNKIQNGDGNVMIESQAKEIEHLQQLLVEKERLIQVLMDKK